MANGQIYTGSTADLKKRILDHRRGNVNTTSKYLPVRLLGYEAYDMKSDAQRREKYLKNFDLNFVRIKDEELFGNPNKAFTKIEDAIKKLKEKAK